MICHFYQNPSLRSPVRTSWDYIPWLYQNHLSISSLLDSPVTTISNRFPCDYHLYQIPLWLPSLSDFPVSTISIRFPYVYHLYQIPLYPSESHASTICQNLRSNFNVRILCLLSAVRITYIYYQCLNPVYFHLSKSCVYYHLACLVESCVYYHLSESPVFTIISQNSTCLLSMSSIRISYAYHAYVRIV